jgi:glycerophosphoryl diester phosphodiesterase
VDETIPTQEKMKIDPLQKPIYIAHRGLSRRFPENTLAAFKGAIDAGAQMIELDVTLSRDRQLVVIHDETVDRTTNGTGPVNTVTLQQLIQLDAGSWFDPKFGDERLPTLSQVLETVKGHLMVNIEIKPEAFEPSDATDSVERQVLALVCKYEMMDEVLISSFHWPVLERLRILSPDISLGLLSETTADQSLLAWSRRIDAFSWHPDFRIVTRPQVEVLHGLGLQIFPYTVGGKMNTSELVNAGVDGLIVDDPDQMEVSTEVAAKGET